MGALDQTFENSVLDAIFDRSGASVRLATGPIHCRLLTAIGTNTANGTELGTSAGYTSGAGAPTFTTSAAALGVETSNSAVTVTNMPATTINAVELWDAVPKRLWWGSLTSPKTTNLGDTFTIASGSLTATLG